MLFDGGTFMEYVDITFNGIEKKNINCFIKNVMDINCSKVIRSHFYTDEYGDFEYNDEIDLNEYFSDSRTCNIFLSSLKLDREYDNVLVIITSDVNDIDITVNIGYEQFDFSEMKKLTKCLELLFQTFPLKNISAINAFDNDPFIVVDSKGTLM